MHIPLLEKQSVVPRLFARHVSTCYYTTFFFELLKISLGESIAGMDHIFFSFLELLDTFFFVWKIGRAHV